MTDFATVTDLEARYRPLSVGEQTRAEALLTDASAMVKASVPQWGRVDPVMLRAVVCAMVRRALLSDGVGEDRGPGIKTWQQGGGPYQETVTYANPTGDLYLTRAERDRLLGSTGLARANNINLLDGADNPRPYWGFSEDSKYAW